MVTATETLIPTVVDQPTASEIERLEAWTQNVIVQNPDQRREVFEAVQSVKSMKMRVVNFFKDSKEKAHATWKAIVANEKGFTDRLDAFEAAGKRAIIKYDQAEEEKRLAEQRRLQAIADEQARKEREKAEAEARRQRQIEEEARQKAEAARRAAEAADAVEREKLLREAEAADRKAATAAAKADAKIEVSTAVVAPVVQISPVATKLKGESTREIWKWRCINISLVPDNYKIINESMLNKLAVATKGAVPIPGIEFYTEKTMAIR